MRPSVFWKLDSSRLETLLQASLSPSPSAGRDSRAHPAATKGYECGRGERGQAGGDRGTYLFISVHEISPPFNRDSPCPFISLQLEDGVHAGADARTGPDTREPPILLHDFLLATSSNSYGCHFHPSHLFSVSFFSCPELSVSLR